MVSFEECRGGGDIYFNLLSPNTRAGSIDSTLTNHGMLQIDYLGRHFASKSIIFDSVFASDLSRARITAEGICRHQPPTRGEAPVSPILTSDLREKDFGSLEGVQFSPTPGKTGKGHARLDLSASATTLPHIESESTASMRRRAILFLNTHFLPLIFDDTTNISNVAIIAHGIILRVLWQCLIELFDPTNISMAPGIFTTDDRPPVLLAPNWSNTGFMTLSIQPSHVPTSPSSPRPGYNQGRMSANATPPTDDLRSQGRSTPDAHFILHGWSIRILALDSRGHLASLRRTRGGIGSSSHDNRQKTIDQFFKR